MTSNYTFEVRNQYGQYVTRLLRPMNREFTKGRNKSGSCQFELDLYDPQATDEILKVNLYDIVVKRQGVPKFQGQISYVHPTIDGDNKRIQVIATGYFDLFDYRIIDQGIPGFDDINQNVPFDPTDTGEIIASLVESTQFPVQTFENVADHFRHVRHPEQQSPNGSFNQSFIAPGSTTVNKIKLLVSWYPSS